VAIDLSRFHEIDWDPEYDPDGNLVHCQRAERLGPNPYRVVHEVLSEEPVDLKMRLETAEFAIVGPDRSRSTWWTVLLRTSPKRSDWLRPVTGWRAEPPERQEWERGHQGGSAVRPWLNGI
jgi:hypothetical protein